MRDRDLFVIIMGLGIAFSVLLMMFSYHMMPPFPSCGEFVTKTQERLP